MKVTRNFIFVIFILYIFSLTVYPQTTTLTYQGRLTDNSTPANGTYQMRFSLFDTVSGGTQVGSTIELSNVQVTNGVFTVELNFGESPFVNGANRFLEIEVRRNAGETYTPLTPRQEVTTTPYAIRSNSTDSANTANNSNQLGGINASQYVQTNDSRLSDARPPTAGSGFYIQNTTSQQTANFNVSGTGTANVFNAGTQFNFNGSRILSSPGTNNTFVGIGTGLNTTSGARNTFVGKDAGINTTDGNTNTFVGAGAGVDNISGSSNSFFGFNSGLRVTSGTQNSVFGVSAGSGNLTGNRNSIFGYEAGFVATGSENSFFGANAGRSTTSGTQNSFFGFQAGSQFTTGSNNTFIGENAGRNFSSGSNNTFIGAETGRNSQFTGNDNTLIGYNARLDGTNLSRATAIGANALAYQDDMIAIGGSSSYVEITGDVFVFSMRVNDNLLVDQNITANGVTANALRITSVSAVSSNNLCINTVSDFVGLCSSSARFKKNVEDFQSGLDLIKKLRPVSFRWKDSDVLDVGLVAEEVFEVEPLLTTINKEGEIQGVKYDRIGVLLINVVKEQQTQIETQNQQIKNQQKQIDELKQIVCPLKPDAEVCQEVK